jgi:hypothetical protein
VKLRRHYRWILWLLPLIAARAVVPVGFMLSAGEHGIEIVLCSGSGPVPSVPRADDHSLHAHNAHHADHDHQQSGGGDDSSGGALCLFAVASAACADVAWSLPAAPEQLAQKIDFGSDAVNSAEPFFPDRIRGPPLA